MMEMRAALRLAVAARGLSTPRPFILGAAPLGISCNHRRTLATTDTVVFLRSGYLAQVPLSSSLPCASVVCRRWCSTQPSADTTTTIPSESVSGVNVSIVGGLPQLTVPLPSRREKCRFTLRPVTHTVKDLTDQLCHEDRGIDRVVLKTKDGVRIASSDSIESVLMEDFDLIINDTAYRVAVPPDQKKTKEEMADMGDVRQLVNKLYMAMNVDQHQVLKQRELLSHLEELKLQLEPLEKKREQLANKADTRANILAWGGLGYMALQFGFLARLTWWEYSWDIMEPVTYFVTYGTAMGAYAYYVLTKTDFILPEVRDRQFLLSFHKRAKRAGMDVEKYNNLKEELNEVESNLARLKDPLALNLPLTHIKEAPSNAPLAKIKNLLGIKGDEK